jgi:hypothetical protein
VKSLKGCRAEAAIRVQVASTLQPETPLQGQRSISCPFAVRQLHSSVHQLKKRKSRKRGVDPIISPGAARERSHSTEDSISPYFQMISCR